MTTNPNDAGHVYDDAASSRSRPFTRLQMENAVKAYNIAYLEHVKTVKIDERAPDPPIYIVDMLAQALSDNDQIRAERDAARAEIRDLRINIEMYERRFYKAAAEPSGREGEG